MSLKNSIKNTASALEDQWDELRFNLKKRLGLNDPLQIVPYRTYGTTTHVYVKGRVLEDKNIMGPGDKDTVLNNVVNMYRRFASDEVPGATLKVKVVDDEHTVITDKEGYYVLKINPSMPIVHEDLWHPLTVELVDAPIPHVPGTIVQAEVMIPPPDAEYGIISDIDDTIIKTSATNLLAMGRTAFLNNAKTRLPFAGVSAFYKALQLGRNGKRNNPFFYVSSSPWNLYDMLIDFLDINAIPAGPIMLRDIGFDGVPKEEGRHMAHKFKEIKQILEAYPHLQFILVGDSGQEDPVIYKAVVEQFPGRILAVYIRDVELPERRKIAIDIGESLRQHEVEMIVVENTVEAADHAADKGFIYTEAIPAIVEDKEQDKGQAPGKEEASAV